MRTPYWTRRTHLFRADEYICSHCSYSTNKPYSVCPKCGVTMKMAKYDPSWVYEAEGLSAMIDDDW